MNELSTTLRDTKERVYCFTVCIKEAVKDGDTFNVCATFVYQLITFRIEVVTTH